MRIQIPFPKIPRLFAGAKASWGLDFNQSKLHLVRLSNLGSKKIRLDQYFTSDLPDDRDNRLSQVKVLLEEKIPLASSVSLAMAGSDVLVRFLDFPKMSMDELRSSMSYELEKYIPFPSADVISDYAILENDLPESKMKILLAAAKKSEVHEQLKRIKSEKFSVRAIDVQTLAVLNCFTTLYSVDLEKTYAIINIGWRSTALIVYMKGKPVFIREIMIGNHDLKQKASAVNISAEDFLSPLMGQVKVSLDFYQGSLPEADTPDEIILTGDLNDASQTAEAFASQNEILSHPWSPLNNLLSDVKIEPADSFSLVAAIGLALRGDK